MNSGQVDLIRFNYGMIKEHSLFRSKVKAWYCLWDPIKRKPFVAEQPFEEGNLFIFLSTEKHSEFTNEDVFVFVCIDDARLVGWMAHSSMKTYFEKIA